MRSLLSSTSEPRVSGEGEERPYHLSSIKAEIAYSIPLRDTVSDSHPDVVGCVESTGSGVTLHGRNRLPWDLLELTCLLVCPHSLETETESHT